MWSNEGILFCYPAIEVIKVVVNDQEVFPLTSSSSSVAMSITQVWPDFNYTLSSYAKVTFVDLPYLTRLR